MFFLLYFETQVFIFEIGKDKLADVWVELLSSLSARLPLTTSFKDGARGKHAHFLWRRFISTSSGVAMPFQWWNKTPWWRWFFPRLWHWSMVWEDNNSTFWIVNVKKKNHNYTEIIALKKKINPVRAAESQWNHQEELHFLPLEEYLDLSGILVNLVHQTSRSEKTPNDTVGSLRLSLLGSRK